MWYVCPMCLDRRGNTSYIGRCVVTRENTTTTDSGRYVVGLHIFASARVGGSLVIGGESGTLTRPDEIQDCSSPQASESGDEGSEPPATERPSGVSPSQTASEEPASHKATHSPPSQLSK